ncbi:MAG: DUF2029 domain-containing protein [Chloroflexales bacterium]|nr:DUF2029 domain-containing protein [Chloroflexales bacterium]
MSSLQQTILKIILIITAAVVFLHVPLPLSTGLGTGDFRPYWSSTFLLAHGQDYGDPSKMYYIERTMTEWNGPSTMYAWFAPTGNVALLPFVMFPFARAAQYWFFTNIVIMYCSALLIWRNTNKEHIWLPLVATFGFSKTLLALSFGQVNTLVVLGLALFLFFSERRSTFASGMSLVLTTIKPHLVILTLPLLLLDSARRKEWRALASFAGALIGCTFVLFLLYPRWPFSFWNVVTSGVNIIRETPTLNGLLVIAGEKTWGKWLWVIGLFLAVAGWRHYGKRWDRRTLIDISLIAGIIVSPFGWSYDQVMLLFPMLRVLGWMTNGSLARNHGIAVALVLIITEVITYYQRILSVSDVWFFWTPFVMMAVYWFAWRHRQTDHFVPATQVA